MNLSKAYVKIAAFAFAAYAGAQAADQSSTTGSFENVDRVSRLLGSEVRGTDGRDLGELENLVVDLESGRVLYAVVDTGDEKVAVAPGAFSDGLAKNLSLKVDRQKLRGAPVFARSIEQPSEIKKASFVHKVHQYFSQPAWWQGSTPADQGSFNNVHKITALQSAPVENVTDQDIGKINNVAVDLPQGRIVFLVVKPEAALNLGSQLYALPPSAFTLSQKSADSARPAFSVNVDKEKLASAPHFDRNDWSRITDQAFASRVYNHFGKQAYFDASGKSDSTLEPTGRRTGTSTRGDVISRERNQRDSDRGWNRGNRSSSASDRAQERRDVLSRDSASDEEAWGSRAARNRD